MSNTPYRFLTLIISIFVALASGTPYLYGVYSPQLMLRCGLTASDSATISFATNIGTGIGGFPAGIIIDKKNPRFAIMLGSISIFVGYYSLYLCYIHAIDKVYLLCLSMILIGFGSITCYFATLKAAQLNFPNHRGLAGAFPVSSYGLSATVFSVISASNFEDNTKGFLRFLAFFCGSVAFFGGFFVNIHVDEEEDEQNESAASPELFSNEPENPTETSSDEESNLIMKPSNYGSFSNIKRDLYSSNTNIKNLALANSNLKTGNPISAFEKRRLSLRGSLSFWGIGTRSPRASISSTNSSLTDIRQSLSMIRTQSMVSIDSSVIESDLPQKILMRRKKSAREAIKRLFATPSFYGHFSLLALLSSIGQMYIFSIGFMVLAQVNKSPSILTTSNKTQQAQALQVSIISMASFGGRLLSGFCSDMLYKHMKSQRLWMVFLSSLVLLIGEIEAVHINQTNKLWILSICNGGSYGMIFGTYPAVIADKFGTTTFSTTWGLMCMGPLVTFFILNKIFGAVYDAHSVDEIDGSGDLIRVCRVGNQCYSQVFELGTILAIISALFALVMIYSQRRRK